MIKLSCTLDENGIYAPTYFEIISALQESYLNIFGSDAYIANDSQDGQLLAIFAKAISDSNDVTIQTYHSFSPISAQGAGLSSQVKINGLRRLIPSKSTVPIRVTGTAGTTLNNATVIDTAGNTWNIPDGVVIPPEGEIVTYAEAENSGAITSAAGDITQIGTPILGWHQVESISDATVGAPVETDNLLRIRQAISTEYPALAVVESIQAAVANIAGIEKSRVYENYTDEVDVNEIPAHSIAVVTQGGTPELISEAIANRKSAGCGTYGDVSNIVLINGHPSYINYFEATQQVITATISLVALTGYTDTIGQAVAQALTDFVNSHDIGEDIFLTRAYAATAGSTYKINTIALGLNSGSEAVADVTILWNGLASMEVESVEILVE